MKGCVLVHSDGTDYVCPMALQAVLKILILSVWLVTMGWLIRYEAFPQWFDETMQGYRELSRHLPALRDSWMKIMSEDQHVGYVNSSIEMTDTAGEEQLQMSTQLFMRIDFQGSSQLLRLNNEVRLDARQNLKSSLSTFSMGPYAGRITLTPTEEERRFQMEVQFNEIKFQRMVDLPAGAVISSPLLDAGLRTVKVGKTVKIRSMDPFSPSAELRTVEITGLSSSTRTLPGESQEVDVTRVQMKFGEWILFAEVDEYGRIVTQETPFGLTFVQSEANSAMKIPDENSLDPFTLLSSPALTSMIKLPVSL